LSANDTGSKEPSFDELKEFVLMKLQASQKKTVYEKERAAREVGESTMTKSTTTTMWSAPSAPAAKPKTATAKQSKTSAEDPVMADITKQLAALTLLMQANIGGAQNANLRATATPAQPYATARTYRCMWSDSVDHQKNRCTELASVVQAGRV
jgi:hypothetical protein